jgi:cyclopropane fatty-acyl-phospholipid synthase-like methyltransferase
MTKREHPEAAVTGLDADEDVLTIAREKAEAAGLQIAWQRSLVGDARFEPASFDRAISSLFFHHLSTDQKRDTFARILGWLRPGGELHVADWGRAHGPLMRLAYLGIQLLDGFETTTDNVQGRLPELMQEVGFVDVVETDRMATVFGTLSLYTARKPLWAMG